MTERDRRTQGNPGRRAEDQLKDAAIARLTHTRSVLARIAFGALAVLALIATLSTLLLWVAHARDIQALDRARTAVHNSGISLEKANKLARAQQAATRQASAAAVQANTAADRSTAALAAASQANAAARAIQASRHELCREANRSHRRTVRAIGRLYRRALRNATTPHQRRRLIANHAATMFVIDALAPHRHCAQIKRP